MMFSRLCFEKPQAVERTVIVASKNHRFYNAIYKKVRSIPNFYTAKPDTLDYGTIVEWFDRPETKLFAVDDVGIVVVVLVEAMKHAHVHITFWDRRLRGREQLMRVLAEKVLLFYRLDYLWTAIPRTSAATLAFAKRIGFQEVGDRDGTVYLMGTLEDFIRANYTV